MVSRLTLTQKRTQVGSKEMGSDEDQQEKYRCINVLQPSQGSPPNSSRGARQKAPVRTVLVRPLFTKCTMKVSNWQEGPSRAGKYGKARTLRTHCWRLSLLPRVTSVRKDRSHRLGPGRRRVTILGIPEMGPQGSLGTTLCPTQQVCQVRQKVPPVLWIIMSTSINETREAVS